MKKMLCVFAHPDDESFTSAGTISKYVKSGWDVELLCATRGEKGETGPLGEITPEALGVIRQKELETACRLLGVGSLSFLEYADGELKADPPGKLENILYEKMIESIPDIVITFDTAGISNHPDHIRLSFAATFAFQKYAKEIEDALKESPDYNENVAPKLYYACVPEETVEYLKKLKIFPEVSFEKPWIGTPDKEITTAISCDGFQLQKKRALRCHVSQSADVERFLSLPNNPLIQKEFYVLRLHGTREVFMGKLDRVSSKL